MSDLDALPLFTPTPATPTGAGPRRHRHAWGQVWDWDATAGVATSFTACQRCSVRRDEQRSRRGRSSRRLGNDQERRAERLYGWRKVGEYGGITDLEDDFVVVQQKATRAPAPSRWRGIFDRLAERAGGRTPLLLLSFVSNGRPTEDFVVLRGRDWIALHGPTREEP